MRQPPGWLLQRLEGEGLLDSVGMRSSDALRPAVQLVALVAVRFDSAWQGMLTQWRPEAQLLFEYVARPLDGYCMRITHFASLRLEAHVPNQGPVGPQPTRREFGASFLDWQVLDGGAGPLLDAQAVADRWCGIDGTVEKCAWQLFTYSNCV